MYLLRVYGKIFKYQFLFFFRPEDSCPVLWFVSFENLTPLHESLTRSIGMGLREIGEDGKCFLEAPLNIECECFFKSLNHSDLLTSDFIFKSDEFIDEDGLFFPFYLDIIELTENEEFFCFISNTFSDAYECIVDFVNSLES